MSNPCFNGQRSLKALEELINNPFWKVEMKKEGTQIYINGKNRTGDIFSEKIALLASDLSQIPEVRQALLKLQRDCFVPQRGLVAEGRDCGTVVFPRARVKIYLTADEKTRAIRRYGQQDDNGIHGLRQDKKEEYRSDSGAEAASLQPGKGENNLKKILENQTLRDKQDVMRKTAPLMIPQGAFVIDSTSLNENQVVKQILDYV